MNNNTNRCNELSDKAITTLINVDKGYRTKQFETLVNAYNNPEQEQVKATKDMNLGERTLAALIMIEQEYLTNRFNTIVTKVQKVQTLIGG